jgi:tetratricopeptide (TPR) repeat protein
LLQENKLIESLYAGAGFYNLAKILRVAGKRKEALEFYERAILIYSRILGDESLHVAMSYNDMGLCYLEELRFSEATSNFDKAIKLSELKCFDSLSRSSFIANRGRALLQVGRVREAQADFKQALNMRKDYLGAEHPMVADMNSLLKLTESVPQQ